MSSSWSICVIFVLLTLTPYVSSRSTGADIGACNDQNPNGKDGSDHTGGIASGNGGFSIVIPKEANPADGETIAITITGGTFLGFVISALPKTVAATKNNYIGQRIGTWSVPKTSPYANLVQPFNCPGDTLNSAMTHSSANSKTSIVFQWTPPPNTNISITLVATIVLSTSTAYMITSDFPTTPNGPTLPGTPTIPFPVSATLDSLNITWTPPKRSTDITTYVIQIDQGVISKDQTHDEPTLPIMTFDTNSSNPYVVIPNLKSGYVYRIAIAAKNDVGISAFTSFLTARVLRSTSIPPTLPVLPVTPITIVPTSLTPTSLTIIWNTNTIDGSLSYTNLQDETLISFQVEKKLGNDLNTRKVVNIVRMVDIRAATFAGLSFNDTGLSPNTTYQYRIITTTLDGSNATEWISITTLDCLNQCFVRAGRGICMNNGQCQCYDGWLGEDCSLRANSLWMGNRRINMQYATTNSYVYVRLTGPSNRWFGVILNPDSNDGMRNGDAWITSYSMDNDGKPKLSINDYYSTGQVTPTTDRNPSDLQPISNTISTNASSVFRRALNTGDIQDAVISSGYMRLSWAVGSSTVLIQHDRGNYGKARIDWIGGNAYELDYSLKYGTFYLPIIIGLGVCIITGLLLRFPPIYRSPLGRLFLRARVPPPLTAPTLLDKLTLDIRPTIQTFSMGEIMIILAYISCFAGMIGYGYQQFINNSRDPRYVWGHVTAVHIALTWLPMTKNSVWLYVFGIPFERAVRYHRMIARMTLICIYIHLGTMIDIWGSSIVTSTNQTYGGNGVVWGFIAMILFSSIVALAYEPIRRFSYELFVYPHFILTKTATVFAMIHSVYLRWFLLVPLVLWGWDQFMGMMNVIRYTQPIESLQRVPAKDEEDIDSPVSILQVKVPPTFKYHPGDYCYLQFPSITQSQWHPFSISSSPSLIPGESQTLTFHILDMGKGTFTHDVAKLASTWNQTKGAKPVQVKIDGPYGRLMIPIYEYSHIILVAGGVGATPMVSILSDLFNRYQHGQLKHLQSVHFIWCSRSPIALTSWWKELFQALQNHPIFKLYLYCSTQKDVGGNPQIQVRPPSREKMMQPSTATSEDSPCCVTEIEDEPVSGPKPAPPSPPDVAAPIELEPPSYQIAIHEQPVDSAMAQIPTSTPNTTIPIYGGRPRMIQLFQSIHSAYAAPSVSHPAISGNAWGVCACGPPPLVASTRQLAYMYDCDWHEETFTI